MKIGWCLTKLITLKHKHCDYFVVLLKSDSDRYFLL